MSLVILGSNGEMNSMGALELIEEILGSSKVKPIPEVFPNISTETIVDESIVISKEDIAFLETATRNFLSNAQLSFSEFSWVDLYCHFNGLSCIRLIAQIAHQYGLSAISPTALAFLRKGKKMENYSAKWTYEYVLESSYCYAGRQLTKQENQAICDFMIDNDIPIRSYTFRTLANRYISGSLYVISCNNCLGEGFYE